MLCVQAHTRSMHHTSSGIQVHVPHLPERRGRSPLFGETSKSMFERIDQHRKQIEKGDNNSSMIEHHEETHREEEKPEFKVEMVRSFQKPLERQVFEGIKIAASKAIPMNRKGEWGQNLPPKFDFEEEKVKPRSRGKTLPQKRKPKPKENEKQNEIGTGMENQLELRGTVQSENKRQKTSARVEALTVGGTTENPELSTQSLSTSLEGIQFNSDANPRELTQEGG